GSARFGARPIPRPAVSAGIPLVRPDGTALDRVLDRGCISRVGSGDRRRTNRRGDLMGELRFTWLELSILLPALGAGWVKLTREPAVARRRSLVVSGLALACAVMAWWDFASSGSREAHDWWDPLARLVHKDLLIIDELSAPLLPL